MQINKGKTAICPAGHSAWLKYPPKLHRSGPKFTRKHRYHHQFRKEESQRKKNRPGQRLFRGISRSRKSRNHDRRSASRWSGLDKLLLGLDGVRKRGVFVLVVLGVLVMVMMEVKHAVMGFGIVVVVFVLVGVAGGVLLLVHADGVLGLVEDGLVGAAGCGGAAGAGVAGAGGGRAGVVVLDT